LHAYQWKNIPKVVPFFSIEAKGKGVLTLSWESIHLNDLRGTC